MLTRREAIVGATAVGATAVAACGRTEPLEYGSEPDGVAASAPEDEEMAQYRHTSPIHLTATTTLASNSSGGVNAIALKNPIGRPMEIHEIKFQLTMEEPSTRLAFKGIIVGCKLDLGKIPITNGFIPIAIFGKGPMADLGGEFSSGSDTTVAPPVPSPATSVDEYSWKLPRPVYIPADAVIIPTFVHGGFIQRDIGVRISYSGRTILSNERPKKIFVPFAAAYVSKTFDFNTADSDSSVETQLINKFDTSIHIQRFGGRIATFDNVNQDIGYYPSAQDLPGLQMINVRIRDSFGRPIVQNFAPFRQVFPAVTSSWETDGAIMDPKSYYIVDIRKDAALAPQDPDEFGVQAAISVVGWREVAL